MSATILISALDLKIFFIIILLKIISEYEIIQFPLITDFAKKSEHRILFFL
jgi:hypothetical protein